MPHGYRLTTTTSATPLTVHDATGTPEAAWWTATGTATVTTTWGHDSGPDAPPAAVPAVVPTPPPVLPGAAHAGRA